MRDLIEMWKETRMIVFTALSAAIYAATVMPLKIATIIPGFTEVRPGVAMVILCSFLFGPAAAWGAAFGNLIADFFGTLGLGSVFGFGGNFLFGLLPYKILRSLSRRDPDLSSLKGWAAASISILLACWVCAFTIAWGVDIAGLVPFHILASAIALNNSVLSWVLAPILLKVIYNRAQKAGFVYYKILPDHLCKASKTAKIGVILIAAGCVFGLTAGISTGFGLAGLEPLKGWILSPCMLLILLGTALL